MDIGKLMMWGAVGYGAYWLYENYASAPAAAPASTPLASAAAAPVASSLPVADVVSAAAAPAASAASSALDSIYQSLKAAAAGDSNFTGSGDALLGGPDHWNYYLKQLTGYDAPLDPLYGTPGNVGRDSGTTAANFWSLVSRGLAKAKGLSGLGFYGGLGQLLQGGRG